MVMGGTPAVRGNQIEYKRYYNNLSFVNATLLFWLWRGVKEPPGGRSGAQPVGEHRTGEDGRRSRSLTPWSGPEPIGWGAQPSGLRPCPPAPLPFGENGVQGQRLCVGQIGLK
ncbi:hypothetical protein ACMV_P4_00140 (plasmid) [Acidiphilium multivorum AIU301]|uniref:Uncharacterized protein n=1 Tax=Acidiphilium multivorum (strain DSM 11245 / JCM 8867 / NBRC 100883 / AIU 301) TaxID=926570 RepID=F0J807_ACIMA|nr:hypothetical protein ACMV_P4_00140 [Acidiphilium multivorum AIU301]GAN74479.1 hypothetical protein Apmu_0177_08 [Acidiphilium multivorum AIU301]